MSSNFNRIPHEVADEDNPKIAFNKLSVTDINAQSWQGGDFE